MGQNHCVDSFVRLSSFCGFLISYFSILRTFPWAGRATALRRVSMFLDVRCCVVSFCSARCYNTVISCHRLSPALKYRRVTLTIQHICLSTTTHGCEAALPLIPAALPGSRCVKSTAQHLLVVRYDVGPCGRSPPTARCGTISADPTAKAQIAQFLTAYDSSIRHEHL